MNAKRISFIALMAVVIAICAWVTIPGPVPFTLQTMGVFLALKVLGGRDGTMAVLVYILLGAIGIPVFAGFSGGFGILVGPTGGYIIGFICMGLAYYGFGMAMNDRFEIVRMVIGLALCYAFGTAWFMLTFARANGYSVFASLMMCVVPFIIPDLAKMLIAVKVGERVKKAVRIEA